MSGKKNPFEKARKEAIERIRDHHSIPDAGTISNRLLGGDYVALSQAITLVESTNPEHQTVARELIQACLAHTGNALRIGITGVPGVGKSTFIEAFGIHLIEKGHRVAVLAIDPSSPVSGGSILGDKTRMEKLSSHPMAFVRPTPSSLASGGVARHTRESIMLCEAAGFNIILVETVGVGQGEVAVHAMTDFFLLLMLAGAGDQLQGIKRGIMELCDGMAITKCDGENMLSAQRARSEYAGALHLFPPRESGWIPEVLTTSAYSGDGIDASWNMICKHENWMKDRGLFMANRHTQDVKWMHESIRGSLIDYLEGIAEWTVEVQRRENEVRSGMVSPFDAADALIRFAIVHLSTSNQGSDLSGE